MFAIGFLSLFQNCKKKQRVDNRGDYATRIFPHISALFRTIVFSRINPHCFRIFPHILFFDLINRIFSPHSKFILKKSGHKISKGRNKFEFRFCGGVNLVVITAKWIWCEPFFPMHWQIEVVAHDSEKKNLRFFSPQRVKCFLFLVDPNYLQFLFNYQKINIDHFKRGKEKILFSIF